MTTFVLFLCTAAAVLALWLVVRFPERGPDDVTKALLHVALSVLVLQLLVPAIHVVGGTGVPGAQLIVSFGIVLPGLTYVFLAAAWMIKAAQSRLQGRY
ncbi:MAG TPA: hypothetical protein VIW19_09790 [Gaiellaceae bacterium]|jgi:hypothetical protein